MCTRFAHLGQPSRIPEAPDAKTLDRAPNPHADTDYVARFTAPEFTSLCPMTGQPDFAHLVIDYAPDKWIVELKSLNSISRASATTAPFTRIARCGSARISSAS